MIYTKTEARLMLFAFFCLCIVGISTSVVLYGVSEKMDKLAYYAEYILEISSAIVVVCSTIILVNLKRKKKK